MKSALNSLLKKIYRNYKIRRTIKSNKKVFKNNIEKLKISNLYNAYPFEKITPSVSHYGFNSRVFKENFDLFYSVLGTAEKDFIPIPVYLAYIEPVLNKFDYSVTIADKNFYDQYIPFIKTPKTFLRKINNHFYDSNYQKVFLDDEVIAKILKDTNKIILKPSIESGAGKNIHLFKKNKGIFKSKNSTLNTEFLKNYDDFVLQEFITQHTFYQQFNPDSNNTIRILVYRSVMSDKIHILHRLLRIGRKGSFLDHDNQGGVTIGINDNGFLVQTGKDYNGIPYNSFNGIKFSNIKEIPFLKKLEETAIQIAKQFYYTRLLAIDFSVNEKGEPLLIEINTKGNGIGQYQMNNGPVFGEFTKEILDYCFR